MEDRRENRRELSGRLTRLTSIRPIVRLLWIATKPPWPPTDGGRLVTWHTLAGLAELGVETVLIAPVAPDTPPERRQEIVRALEPVARTVLVSAAPRSLPAAGLGSLLRREPLAVARHRLPAVRDVVARLLESERFDVVHAEQVHALAQAEPAFARNIPVVLRAQNVESDLWARTAPLRPWASLALRVEAWRMARYEGAAVSRVGRAVALTQEDARRLSELAGGSGGVDVIPIPAPYPDRLPASDQSLPGDPPVVLLGGGWLPNREGADWFTGRLWPAIRQPLPGAVLHLYTDRPDEMDGVGTADGVVHHPPPDDSRDVFVPGAVLVVPLRIASGVRMKILEAWARGVPVVATPRAALGLGDLTDLDGDCLLLADGDADRDKAGAGFVRAFAELRDPERRRQMVEAGRRRLMREHDPRSVAERLVAVYEAAISSPGGSSPSLTASPGSSAR